MATTSYLYHTLEGLKKIKVLKRQAYGFRDKKYFKPRLYFLHNDTPAFAG